MKKLIKRFKHFNALKMSMVDEVYKYGVDGVKKRIFAGEYGVINMNAILVLALLAAVTFIVLATLFPSMQTANAVIQSSTATDAGTVNGKMVFNLMVWIIPLGIGIALIIRVLHSGNK